MHCINRLIPRRTTRIYKIINIAICNLGRDFLSKKKMIQILRITNSGDKSLVLDKKNGNQLRSKVKQLIIVRNSSIQ